MSDYRQFQDALLSRMSDAFGIRYDLLAADYRACNPTITGKMLRLAMIGEPRKWKRAWRLYFQANGKNVARSPFSQAIADLRFEIMKRRMHQMHMRVYEQWLAEKHATLPAQSNTTPTEAISGGAIDAA
ncbi:hypothetical protein SZ64_04285 [Erythrobacter sp. SG61-1L]|uniref:hypothetical protein n=1 Tax=Erythrobacter sp. SG61-1L TaxID=1603897 RepID=UPI0006C92173|nr:hypothetical protein [Erythrobacter sp. SG61-1L]KPL67390.1 hypothetical protein SZ64_04285 [Erythrobacter sp. SG61-1L]